MYVRVFLNYRLSTTTRKMEVFVLKMVLFCLYDCINFANIDATEFHE